MRSEGEFAQGHIAGFTNFPILADSERHQVGLTYRHEGNQKAVELGYALFNPQKTERVAAWIKHSQGGPIWVSCWRGGLRSKLSCQFISEAGGTPIQITGGYKALRALLTKPLKNPPAALCVIRNDGKWKKPI